MENATPKLRKKSFTIVEQACHEIHGFSKLYQELCDKVTLSGQTQSTLKNYARKLAHLSLHFGKLPQYIDEREVSRLELKDIDSGRMMIHIRRSKYNKDRYVPLSPLILEGLRKYYYACQPVQYLFNGNEPGSPLSVRGSMSSGYCMRYRFAAPQPWAGM